MAPVSIPLSGCFCVSFNQRVGYKTIWKQLNPFPSEFSILLDTQSSSSTTALREEVVQRKSIPPGLAVPPHGRDVTHFRIGNYLGVSAVGTIQASKSQEADLIAVSLVTLLFGEDSDTFLWHQVGLVQSILEKFIYSGSDEAVLNELSNQCKAGLPMPGSNASLFRSHPDRAMISFLKDFGPMIFPLCRAALVASRVLFHSQEKMEKYCKFGNTPLAGYQDVCHLLTLAAEASLLSCIDRIPLNVTGFPSSRPDSVIPDAFIPDFKSIHPEKQLLLSVVLEDDFRTAEASLPRESNSNCWVACSSDPALAEQDELFDIRTDIVKVADKSTVKVSHRRSCQTNGVMKTLKASLRDNRRFQYLYRALVHLDKFYDTDELTARENTETDPHNSNAQSGGEIILEYHSNSAEWERDVNMLLHWCDFHESPSPFPSLTAQGEIKNLPRMRFDPREQGILQTRAMFYFSHMTAQIFEVLGGLVAASAERDSVTNKDVVQVSKHDMEAMGVDPASHGDREWVQEMIQKYFERESYVEC